MPNYSTSFIAADATGVCSLTVNYTAATAPPPHTMADGPVSSVVASNTGPRGSTVTITTKAQGSDPTAVQQPDGTWLHTISAPSGTLTLGPGTANQTQFGWWGVTNASDVVGMSAIPPS